MRDSSVLGTIIHSLYNNTDIEIEYRHKNGIEVVVCVRFMMLFVFDLQS